MVWFAREEWIRLLRAQDTPETDEASVWREPLTANSLCRMVYATFGSAYGWETGYLLCRQAALANPRAIDRLVYYLNYYNVWADPVIFPPDEYESAITALQWFENRRRQWVLDRVGRWPLGLIWRWVSLAMWRVRDRDLSPARRRRVWEDLRRLLAVTQREAGG